MRKLKPLFMLLLLLALPILACGGGGNEEPTATTAPAQPTAEPTLEPTATPAPTNTPEPTATPAPTNTPEPTATPEPTGPVIPEGFDLFESEGSGVAVYYPSDWFSDDGLGVVSIASNEDLIDGADPGEEGAVVAIVSESTDEDLGLPASIEDGALVVLTAILENPDIVGIGTDFEVVKPATLVENSVDGHDVATAVAHATANNGTRLAVVIKFIISDTRFALFLGATPVETQEQYEGTLDAIGNSVTLSEPVGGDTDISTPTIPNTSEAVPVALGDMIEGQLNEDVPQRDYLYTATAGETFAVTVIPETDDQDLIVSILAADDSHEELFRVDNGFSGEGETLVYTFATDGNYIIRVAEFGFPDGGLFFLSVDKIANLVIGTTEGLLPDKESKLFYLYQATGGESLTFTLTPGNTEMDVVIKIYRAEDMETAIAEIDSGFSGASEVLTYTFAETGKYIVEISEYFGTGGNVILEVVE